MQTKRSGLAPLEFVLWLPVLLFVAALMVNFGTLAGWRLRGEVVARDMSHRARWPRSGATEPRVATAIWPADAVATVRSTPAWTSIDIPQVRHEVARGPMPAGFGVKPLLDPSQGGNQGVSEINRRYPMLSNIGEYNSGEMVHATLGDTFRNSEMSFSTLTRRTTVLYEFPVTEQSLPERFANSVNAIVGLPHFADLAVLDQDEELRDYYGYYPDFHAFIRHPYVRMWSQVLLQYCELDRDTIYEEQVVPKIDGRNRRDEVVLGQISRLPRRLTNTFLSMYNAMKQDLQDEIDALEQEQQQLEDRLNQIPGEQSNLESQITDLQNQLASLPPSSPNRAAIEQQISDLQQQLNALNQEQQQGQNRLNQIPGLIADAQAKLAEIEPKIKQLEEYRDRLDSIEESLKEAALQWEEESGIPLPDK